MEKRLLLQAAGQILRACLSAKPTRETCHVFSFAVHARFDQSNLQIWFACKSKAVSSCTVLACIALDQHGQHVGHGRSDSSNTPEQKYQ